MVDAGGVGVVCAWVYWWESRSGVIWCIGGGVGAACSDILVGKWEWRTLVVAAVVRILS